MRKEVRDSIIARNKLSPMEPIVLSGINKAIVEDGYILAIDACCLLAEIERLKAVAESLKDAIANLEYEMLEKGEYA